MNSHRTECTSGRTQHSSSRSFCAAQASAHEAPRSWCLRLNAGRMNGWKRRPANDLAARILEYEPIIGFDVAVCRVVRVHVEDCCAHLRKEHGHDALGHGRLRVDEVKNKRKSTSNGKSTGKGKGEVKGKGKGKRSENTCKSDS